MRHQETADAAVLDRDFCTSPETSPAPPLTTSNLNTGTGHTRGRTRNGRHTSYYSNLPRTPSLHSCTAGARATRDPDQRVNSGRNRELCVGRRAKAPMARPWAKPTRRRPSERKAIIKRPVRPLPIPASAAAELAFVLQPVGRWALVQMARSSHRAAMP